MIPLLLALCFFLRYVHRSFQRVFQTRTNKNKCPKCFPNLCLFFFSFFIWLDFSRSLAVPFFSPSLSPHPFVLITTKPCHHGSCSHVNQPSQHHLFPAVYLQAKQRSLPFCCRWGEALRWLRANSTRRYQPSSLKRPIQHRESIELREDVNVGVVGHLETISNPSFPKEPRQTDGGKKESHHKQTWKANK